jgi:hypothetical protein
LPALYSPGGKVTDLRNLIPANYNSRIRRGYDIYPNRLGFLDRQVVSACSSRFVELSGDPCGPFWRVEPPYLARPMWSHDGIRVYTPTLIQQASEQRLLHQAAQLPPLASSSAAWLAPPASSLDLPAHPAASGRRRRLTSTLTKKTSFKSESTIFYAPRSSY